jgi:xanthine/CO dehydrogenase XdhC/CoxF family maturation factor
MANNDTDVLATAEAWRRAGRRLALATVVVTRGSAPRAVGARLVVDADGDFRGSVSGGCIEGDVITEALDVIERGRPKMLEFGAGDEVAWRSGLACGSIIRIYVEPIDD